MDILVTGGQGFIGSHLCEKLLELGHNVLCVDNGYTSVENNIRHLLKNDRFRFQRWDITDPLVEENSAKHPSFHNKFDQIYNLACPASPVYYQQDPVKTLMTCVQGSYNVLEAAKKWNARVLQTSTSEVYGDPLIHPQTEDYRGNVNTVGPRSCYDEGKRAAETLYADYRKNRGVETRIVRIFNTYGPRMFSGDGRVIPNFITQALNNEDITVFGDGSQTRSFCYVDDLVDGLIRLMNHETFFGPVNIGNPNEMTILQTAKLIIELTNSDSKVIFKDLPQDDPLRRKPDIQKAEKELGWRPSTDVKDGFLKTIEYFSKIANK